MIGRAQVALVSRSERYRCRGKKGALGEGTAGAVWCGVDRMERKLPVRDVNTMAGARAHVGRKGAKGGAYGRTRAERLRTDRPRCCAV